MAIVSHKHRVVFFPLPKNCSTSLKHFFYVLETGRPFRKAKNKFGLIGHVHTYFPTQTSENWIKFYNSYESMVVVRDPISRFLSGYGNRIIHARALERHGNVIGRLQTEKLPILPDIGFFVDNMERYLDISPYVRNHLAPQCSVIGGIFDKINKIYPISRVHEIPEFFSKERGLHISLPHEQSAGPKFTLSHLSRQQVDKLVDFYKDDYNMLKDHYNAP